MRGYPYFLADIECHFLVERRDVFYCEVSTILTNHVVSGFSEVGSSMLYFTIVHIKKDGDTNGSGVPSNVFFVVISKARFLKWCKCGVNKRVLATSRHIF